MNLMNIWERRAAAEIADTTAFICLPRRVVSYKLGLACFVRSLILTGGQVEIIINYVDTVVGHIP